VEVHPPSLGEPGVVTMTHQEAVSVVAAPLEAVERRLRDVTNWPQFLLGLDEVTETSFCRYCFTVRDGRSTRVVDVAVTPHAREHRTVWRALAGPRFDGEIRLAAVDEGHTRVSLSLTAEPAGFLAGLSDMVRMSHTTTAMLDLQRLEAMVTGASA
jgi:uncharacterized membrane protein